VLRLQYRVRDPRANYLQSLSTLRAAKNYARTRGRKLFTKSAIMLGLGEERAELTEAFDDLRGYDVDVLTLGQYLRPSLKHLPVERYVTPEEFVEIGREAESKGFLYVASGPMVRSSYRAAEFFMQGHVEAARQLGSEPGRQSGSEPGRQSGSEPGRQSGSEMIRALAQAAPPPPPPSTITS